MSTKTRSVSGQGWDADFAAADLEHEFGAGAARVARQPEHDSDEMALEAAQGLTAGLAFRLAAFEVGARSRLPTALHDGDLVQRGVQLAVAVAVEAVAALLAGGAIDGRDPGEPGELGLVAKARDTGGLADSFAAISTPQPLSSSSRGA